MLIYIGSNDITDIVVRGSYKMDKTQKYESFTDGNMVEHRIITAEKIGGQFEVVLSDKNDCNLAEFKEIWDAAVTNGYVLATVYVTNTGETKTINAYYTMTNKQHTETADGDYIDVLTIKLEER